MLILKKKKQKKSFKIPSGFLLIVIFVLARNSGHGGRLLNPWIFCTFYRGFGADFIREFQCLHL